MRLLRLFGPSIFVIYSEQNEAAEIVLGIFVIYSEQNEAAEIVFGYFCNLKRAG